MDFLYVEINKKPYRKVFERLSNPKPVCQLHQQDIGGPGIHKQGFGILAHVETAGTGILRAVLRPYQEQGRSGEVFPAYYQVQIKIEYIEIGLIKAVIG